LNSLSEFIALLEEQQELIRIHALVSPILEITEVADRVMKSPHGGKALLFENNGTDFALLINAFGSEKRMKSVLRSQHYDTVPNELMSLAKLLMGKQMRNNKKLKLLPQIIRKAGYFPTSSKGKAACQQVVFDNPDLSKLPIMQCWPHDGGRFITLPIVLTQHPETGVRNAGMYRMQVFDEKTTGMHWHMHKGGAAHYRAYKKLRKKMPVAVILGGDPLYTYAATAPLPDGIDEFIMTGFLRRKKVRFVKCLTQAISVPEDADIVIEGYIDPDEALRTEGPFGDHTGVYSLPDEYPVFHVTCITHRKNAVYPSTIVGVPPMEDEYMALATERIFVHALKMMHPEISDIYLPSYGVAHNLVFIKMTTDYPGHALKIMHALLGNGQMMFAKVIVCVPESFNFSNFPYYLQAIISQIDMHTDVHISMGPADVLDHAAYKMAQSGKILIDATQTSNNPTDNNDEVLFNKIAGYDCCVFGNIVVAAITPHEAPSFGDIAATIHQLQPNAKLIAVVNSGVEKLSPYLQAWYVLNSIDPGYDCLIQNNCLYVNAQIKSKTNDNFNRDWPNIVSMNESIINKIDKEWSDIIGCDLIPSPSSRVTHLLSGYSAVYNHKTSSES